MKEFYNQVYKIVDLEQENNKMFQKIYYDKEVECYKCHQKIKPIIEVNRVKSEFFGATYSGKDKACWLICPECKMVIGTK